MPDQTQTPLAGRRVLDLTNVLAGPFACHQLAHLGAEVIKIERPGTGDLARQLGADPALNDRGMGVSFLAQNAGKRSVTLDLKHPKGKEILRRLARGSDVVVENFRPGVMARLGLGPEVLRADNPRLVYCAISGFGQDGPWRDRPAYDQIVQGISGIMAATGAPGGPPMRAGFPVSDTVAGLTAAMAISAALAAPEPGCVIDISMLEATLSSMAWAVSNHLIAGVAPAQHGNVNSTASPSGLFRTGDGHINIAANSTAQWESLARALDRADLLADPAFADRQSRIVNRRRLTAELETVLTTQPSDTWVEALNAAGVPCGPVLTVPEILAHPQIADRGFLSRMPLEGAPDDRPDARIDVVRAAAKFDGVAAEVALPPRTLGADTEAVLSDLGFATAEIAALRDAGVV